MKVLTFLMAVCSLIGFGWLFLSPGNNGTGQAGIDMIKSEVTAIYDSFNQQQQLDRERDADEGSGNVATTSYPSQTVGPEEVSQQHRLGPMELKTETLSEQSIKPQKKTSEAVGPNPNKHKEDEPKIISLNRDISVESDLALVPSKSVTLDPTVTTAGLDPMPVVNDGQATIQKPIYPAPSDAEIDRYLGRIQAAGTSASTNLERAARLLGLSTAKQEN